VGIFQRDSRDQIAARLRAFIAEFQTPLSVPSRHTAIIMPSPAASSNRESSAIWWVRAIRCGGSYFPRLKNPRAFDMISL
jgi:hypothetical protein